MADNLNSMNLSRRTALAGGLIGAAGLIAGSAGAALSASHPNSEMLVLGRQFEIAWADEQRAWNAGTAAADKQTRRALTAQAEELSERTSAIISQIEARQATTLEELRVKARAVSWCCCGDLTDFDQKTTDMRLVASILRDLLSEAVSHG